MSNLNTVHRRIRFNNESISGTVTIPTWVKIVEIHIYPNGGSNSADDYIDLRFNSDTGSNYAYYVRKCTQAGGYTWVSTTASSIRWNKFFDTTTPAYDQSCARMVLYPRTSTEYNTGYFEEVMGDDGASGEVVSSGIARWLNATDPINSITFYSPGSASLSADVEIRFIG